MRQVAAALIIRGNRILIARRAPTQKHAGLWEFPGGKQEDGETIQQCLEREMREEFGVTCTALHIFMESPYVYAQGAINLVGIITELHQEQLILSVHDAVAWVAISELLAYALSAADIPIAEALIQQTEKTGIN